MEVIVHPDATRASIDAAKRLLSTVESDSSATLMLPTGATPKGLYEQLRSESAVSAWARTTVFALDEYVGKEGDDRDSFRFQLWDELCRPLGMRPSQLFTPNGMADDLQAEASRYENLISSHQPLSLTVLGVGANGHIAFNEPGTSWTSRTHVATLTPQTQSANQEALSGQVPTHAITVGIQTIVESSALLLLAFGESKREAIQALIAGTARTDIPVTALADHPGLTVLLDETCASGIEGLSG